MDKWIALSCVLGLTLLSQSVAASNKRYLATPEQSQWQITENTPLICRMVHPIPFYGEARFSSEAGKKINLDFELKMFSAMGETRDVSLVSMPPAWRPGENADTISQLKFFKQFDGYVGGQTAWGILSELEKGRAPTFSYSDWKSLNQRVEVGLSSVKFQKEYDAFNQCLANLLPYSFEDIAFTILHYERQGDQLTKTSKKRLAQIADYIRYNQDIDLVVLATYTDSSLSQHVSQDLSDRRAESLRAYFSALGLPEDQIQIQGYGKRRPIAENSNEIGRSKNRRVVISFGRTEV